MNFLHVLTKPVTPERFIVYWTNSTEVLRGAISINVPVSMEDRHIIAELYGMQYLLEIEEVVGNNAAGHENIKIIASLGAVRKLSRKASDKKMLAEYAKFLTTRFKGCSIVVEKDEKWIGSGCEPSIMLDASLPMDEKILVHGFGEVLITSHIVERFAERFGVEHLGDAWRKLRSVAAEKSVAEIEKNNMRTKMKYAMRGREEGRYFYHSNKELMLVVAKNAKGQPSLVTMYKIAYE